MMEKVLVLIKPDGVKRKLIGEIIKTYEDKNINITALKMLMPSREQAENHYAEHKGRDYFERLVNFICSGNICAMVLEGEDVIMLVRKVNGDKDVLKAELGSIRGRFANNKTENLVHASDTKENAKREISFWFPELT